MVLLDAYALIALFADEPAAGEVGAVTAANETGMTAVNLAEAVDVMQRVYGFALDDVDLALEHVFPDSVELVAVDWREARRAGMFRATYYDPRELSLSLADCFLLAAARNDDAVATADPAVLEVAHREGIETIALPDSTGRRP